MCFVWNCSICLHGLVEIEWVTLCFTRYVFWCSMTWNVEWLRYFKYLHGIQNIVCLLSFDFDSNPILKYFVKYVLFWVVFLPVRLSVSILANSSLKNVSSSCTTMPSNESRRSNLISGLSSWKIPRDVDGRFLKLIEISQYCGTAKHFKF